MTLRDPRTRDTALLLALGVFVRLGALTLLGSQPAADSGAYVQAASEWARTGFRPAWLVWEYPSFYPGYIAFLALSGGGAFSLFVQTLAGAFVPAAFYLALRRAGGSRLQGALAALALATSYEIARWNGYLLTDSLFVTASSLALMTVILALRPGGWRWVAGAGTAVILALSLRPTGLAVAAGALGAAAAWRPWRRDLVLVGLAALVIFGAYLALRPIPASRVLYAGGVCWNLVSGRVFWGTDAYGVKRFGDWPAWANLGLARCYGRAVTTAPGKVAQLLGRRAIAYWTPVYGHYSPKHNLANLVLLGVPLGLAFVGVCRSPAAIRADPLALVPLAWILAFTAQHALTWVEGDHRLLVAALPAVYVLAAGGVERLSRAGSRALPERERGRETPTDLAGAALPEGGRGERQR